jgi:phage tail sheath gpL-like
MAGLVAFNQMPGDIRVPLFYAEVNAGTPPYSGTSATLLVGRKLSAGSATIGVPVNIGSADPNALFGAGSQLAEMALFARWHNPTGVIFALPVTDPGSAVAAAGAFVVTGTATAGGTLVRYVAGERYEVGVASGDTAAVVATALFNKINAGYTRFNRAMTSSVVATNGTAGTTTLTARHAGTEGNSIRLEAGLDGDEVDPAGISVAITAMASGAGDVDMAAALATLGAQQFDWIVGGGYNTTTQLNAVRDFLSDAGSGRWSPTVGLDGHYITARDGNLSSQTTFGAGRNDRHVSILGTHNYPHAPWAWAAALGGVVGLSKNLGRALTEAIEIARPLQTLALQGLRPPKALSDQWALSDRDSLYRNGIGAVTFGADGLAHIDRIVTSYLTNLWAQPDITFLDIETIAITAYVKRYIKSVVTSTYPRHVLRDDNPRGLQGVVTPNQITATMVHAYTELSEVAGVVEKPNLFAKYLIVERSSDPNRVNVYLPVDVANQLRVFAANITIFAELNDQIASGL